VVFISNILKKSSGNFEISPKIGGKSGIIPIKK